MSASFVVVGLALPAGRATISWSRFSASSHTTARSGPISGTTRSPMPGASRRLGWGVSVGPPVASSHARQRRVPVRQRRRGARAGKSRIGSCRMHRRPCAATDGAPARRADAPRCRGSDDRRRACSRPTSSTRATRTISSTNGRRAPMSASTSSSTRDCRSSRRARRAGSSCSPSATLFATPRNRVESLYDELLVVRPPKRVVGGVTVQF